MTDTELSPRERQLVALTAAAAAEPLDDRLDDAAHDAVASGALTVEELLEAVLHVAVYAGWPRASHLEMVLGQQWARVHAERGEDPAPWPELEPDDRTTGADRRAAGLARFEEVNGFPSPPCDTPYRQAVVEWVFGDLWWRPGLRRRDRRLISITCVALTGAPFPLAIHVGTALTSGDLSETAMEQVVEVLTPYCSPTRAAALVATLTQAADQVNG
jgi:4-carboxymuconolactone decarboxylase